MEIAINDVERRFIRAIKTIHVLPEPGARFLRYTGGMSSIWQNSVNNAEEAYGYTEETLPRFRPTRADVGDVLTALAWARPLEKNELRLVEWRARGLSHRQVAARIGRSDETARRRYLDIMLKVWLEANTRKMPRAA